MKIKATVLCENTAYGMGPIAEHGWSVHIETNKGTFLFDTGGGKALINNANFFKKDLSQIDGIIISHHHSDHTGGLLNALSLTGPKKVYTHPDLFKESYLTRSGSPKYIGIPFCQKALESGGASFVFNKEYTEIAPGMYLTGEVPRLNDFELGDKDQVVLTSEGFKKDPLLDDQSLVMETEKGLFIILGCSHAGIINILNYAIKKTGQSHIHTIIGGTHLGPVSDEQREKSIKALKEFDIERIGVSHCTGMKGSMRLAQEYGDKFFFCNVGTVIES